MENLKIRLYELNSSLFLDEYIYLIFAKKNLVDLLGKWFTLQ